MECLFCKMVNGEILTEKVYEDAETMAFLDSNPSSPGHTLVIPKQHKENILELSDHEICILFKTVQKVTEMINKNLKPKGFNIGINHGLIAGARIPHLHVHIIPRFEDDGGGMIQMVVKNPPKEDPTLIAAKIRGNYELPEYAEEKVEEEEREEVNFEEPEEIEEKKKDEYFEEKEKELFPPKVKKREEPEKEEEDVYEKMLKNMRIPN